MAGSLTNRQSAEEQLLDPRRRPTSRTPTPPSPRWRNSPLPARVFPAPVCGLRRPAAQAPRGRCRSAGERTRHPGARAAGRELRWQSRIPRRCVWPASSAKRSRRRIAKASRVEREFDFLMSVEDLVIRGQVDLWFQEGGELVIVDYKTDDVTASQAHQRAQDYAPQLRLYAMAVERVAGRPVDRAWLHFLRPNVGGGESGALAARFARTDRARFQEAQSEGRISVERRGTLPAVRFL
jgi:hypothetical protein